MKKFLGFVSVSIVFLLFALAASGCAPKNFDVDGTASEIRRNGFKYRDLSGEKAAGNYFTENFEYDFNSQSFYNYLYVQKMNYPFYENYKTPTDQNHTQAINAVANAAGSFLEFWNDKNGKPQYILLLECVSEENADKVFDLLKNGAGKGYSWVLHKNIAMSKSGSAVVLYTSNAASFIK